MRKTYRDEESTDAILEDEQLCAGLQRDGSHSDSIRPMGQHVRPISCPGNCNRDTWERRRWERPHGFRVNLLDEDVNGGPAPGRSGGDVGEGRCLKPLLQLLGQICGECAIGAFQVQDAAIAEVKRQAAALQRQRRAKQAHSQRFLQAASVVFHGPNVDTVLRVH